jgi:hypothetical protein
VGNGHISMSLRGGGKVISAIAFRPKLPPPSPGEMIDVAFEARRELWQDLYRLSLHIRDWRPAIQ